MRLVLKLKNAENLYYSNSTRTGLTRSIKKATNCNIKRLVDISPRLLDVFDLLVVEPGKTMESTMQFPDKNTQEIYQSLIDAFSNGVPHVE
jgi:hypothetical protein